VFVYYMICEHAFDLNLILILNLTDASVSRLKANVCSSPSCVLNAMDVVLT